MDRVLVMRVSEGFVASYPRFSKGKLRQDPCKRTSRRISFETQFLQPPFPWRTHTDDELHGNISKLVRRKENIMSVPGVWMMGGGPRTYPGGLRKWQWKKREKEEFRHIESTRLCRERKLLEARRRQEREDANVASTLELVKNSSWREILGGQASPVNPLVTRSLSKAAQANDCLEVVKNSVSDTEGSRFSATLREEWTGSRQEVAEQIEKVRNLVRDKHKPIAGSKGDKTTSLFEQFPLSLSSLKALRFVLGLHSTTPITEATFPVILKGGDLLVRTEGGTEDIIVSLLYAIEVILRTREQSPLPGIVRQHLSMTRLRHPPSVLLVCPTQERATFVAAEAKKLLTFHSRIRLQLVMGGNDMRQEIWRLRRLACEILIATPGRLHMHLRTSPEVREQLSSVKLLVLDRVQQLIDMGYSKTIEGIAGLVCQTRQTLMWSTSKSDEVCEGKS